MYCNLDHDKNMVERIKMDGKMCPNCYTFKPLSDFRKRIYKGKNVGQPYCIPCKRMLDRAYVRAKREK